MRRSDREVTDIRQKLEIINKSEVCRLAFSAQNKPYIVPMNFGFRYENETLELVFHCATEGKKLDMLKENPNVCFEMDCGYKLVQGETACSSTMEYESVIGFGTAQIIEDQEEKRKALDIMMSHYCDQPSFSYDEKYLKAIKVIKVTSKEFSGKRRKK